jgi:hypothetical protein
MTATYFETSITVEAAFGYGPTDTPAWTDITDYVRDFEINRGRADEFGSYSPGTASVVLDNRGRRFDPSHAAGDYFGDLVPMVPLRIKAIYAAALTDEFGEVLTDGMGGILGVGPGESVEYPLYYGFVQGWPQQYIQNIDSTVTVNCVDAFRLLEQATLAASVYRSEVEVDGAIAYWPFQDGDTGERADTVTGLPLLPASGQQWTTGAIDWIPGAGSAQSDGPGTLSYLQTGTFLGADPFAVDCVFECDTFLGFTSDISVVAKSGTDSYLRIQVSDDNVSVTFSNATANQRQNAGGDVYYFQTGRTYHVAASVDGDDVLRVYVDGALISEDALSAGTETLDQTTPMGVQVSDGNRVAHFAVYDAPLTSTRIAAHYDAGRFAFGGDFVEYPGARIGRVLDSIGWPSGTRDIADGGIELGEYMPNGRSALDYIREVELTEQGLFYATADGELAFRDRAWQFDQTSFADFGDTAPDLEFHDVVPDGNTVDVITNKVKVIYNQSDSNVVVEDATSIATYGYESDELSAPLIQTINPARGLASFRVRVGKDPRTRVSSLLVKPRANPADLFPAVLAADLGKVLTVSFTPIGVGSASTFVTSIQGIRHRVGRGEWDVEFYLAPAVSESGPYWKIGDATLGKIGAAFGNKLSY